MHFKDMIQIKETELNKLKNWYRQGNAYDHAEHKYYINKLEELLNDIIHLQSLAH